MSTGYLFQFVHSIQSNVFIMHYTFIIRTLRTENIFILIRSILPISAVLLANWAFVIYAFSWMTWNHYKTFNNLPLAECQSSAVVLHWLIVYVSLRVACSLNRINTQPIVILVYSGWIGAHCKPYWNEWTMQKISSCCSWAI